MLDQLHDQYLSLDAERYVTFALASRQEVFHVRQTRGPELRSHRSADNLDRCLLTSNDVTSHSDAPGRPLADCFT